MKKRSDKLNEGEHLPCRPQVERPAHSVSFDMRALNIIFAVLASILLPLQAKAFEDVRTPIVVAVQSGAYDLYFEAAESLYEGLSRGLNDHAVEFKEVDVEKLRSGEAADYDSCSAARRCSPLCSTTRDFRRSPPLQTIWLPIPSMIEPP